MLIAAAALGLSYAYGVAPPERRVGELRAELATVKDRLRMAAESIQQVRDLERECSSIRTQLAQRGQSNVSPLFWFPEQMSNYFGQSGIKNVSARVNTECRKRSSPAISGRSGP